MNQGLSFLLFCCPNDISFVAYKGVTSNIFFLIIQFKAVQIYYQLFKKVS